MKDDKPSTQRGRLFLWLMRMELDDFKNWKAQIKANRADEAEFVLNCANGVTLNSMREQMEADEQAKHDEPMYLDYKYSRREY